MAEDEDRIVCAIRALAGAARLSEQPEAQSYIESARFMIDVKALPSRHFCCSSLGTELSSTVTGHLNQALRALEAARVLDDRGSIAVCYVYWAKALFSTGTSEAHAQAISLLGEAASETRALPNDPLRHHIDLWLADCMMDVVADAEKASYEVLLRRIAEDMASMSDAAERHAFPFLRDASVLLGDHPAF